MGFISRAFRHAEPAPRRPRETTRLRGALRALAVLLLLAAGRSVTAQTALVDTGPGSNTTIGALSLFDNNFGFQHLGAQFVLAQPAVVGSVEGWMAPPGGTLRVRVRANTSNLPGSVLFTASQSVPNTPVIGWTSVGGLDWSLPAGTYWVTFEPLNPTPGFGSMPVGPPQPLPGNAFLSDGNPGWVATSPGQTLGVRIFTPVGSSVISVPGDHATIQAAIDVAPPSAVIEVAPGTYAEALNFGGRTITVRSSDGAAQTIIDATGTNLPAVTIGPGSQSGTLLKGFTIRGGDAAAGLQLGGGVLVNASTAAIEDCVLTGNAADSGGGAAAYNFANVQFTDCVLDGNTADSGGGASVSGSASASFERCTFGSNHADTSGGGAYVNSASADFVDCTFADNDASGGGGLNVNVQATATLTDCRFVRNSAVNSGGGLSVLGGLAASATLTGCRIEENTAPGAAGAGINGSTATFIDCDFLNNVATTSSPVSGGGLQAQGAGTLLVNGSRFTGNRAANGAGALLILYTGSASFTGSAFTENIATFFGGGLAATNGSAGTLSGCTFSDNEALAGGGVFAGSGTSLAIGGTASCGNAPDHVDGTFTNNGGNTSAATCTGWTDLGYALDGTAGLPRLTGSGSLASGQLGTLTLTDARPSSSALYLAGISKLPVPFKGGTLVPVPPQLMLSLGTNGAGTIVLPFLWPPGLPSGFAIYHQFVIQDPAGTFGFALSNAIKSQAP